MPASVTPRAIAELGAVVPAVDLGQVTAADEPLVGASLQAVSPEQNLALLAEAREEAEAAVLRLRQS